jgi:probable phosphoglycerate mutase
MTSRVILARHGNTFRPEDTPVMVGARSDLPLVEKGLLQAGILGDALAQSGLHLTKVTSGPLQRTRQTAEIVAQKLSLSLADIHIDPRLTEIDFGAWEGKTSAEILAICEKGELEAWDKKSIYPPSPHWHPSEAQLVANTKLLLTEAQNGTSLIVTSNGILRFFAQIATNAPEFPDRKVATGHICVMDKNADDTWHIIHWNQSPSVLFQKIPT